VPRSKQSGRRASRRRVEPRRTGELSLDRSLAILELLASHPAGLTVFEIAAQLHGPTAQVIGSIAILQRRGWLQRAPECDRLVLGERIASISRSS
jgi:DNA-binding IclR family transcriptional regulator